MALPVVTEIELPNVPLGFVLIFLSGQGPSPRCCRTNGGDGFAAERDGQWLPAAVDLLKQGDTLSLKL